MFLIIVSSSCSSRNVLVGCFLIDVCNMFEVLEEIRAEQIRYHEALNEEVAFTGVQETLLQELRQYIIEANVTKCEFLIAKRLEKVAEESKKESADATKVADKERKHIKTYLANLSSSVEKDAMLIIHKGIAAAVQNLGEEDDGGHEKEKKKEKSDKKDEKDKKEKKDKSKKDVKPEDVKKESKPKLKK